MKLPLDVILCTDGSYYWAGHYGPLESILALRKQAHDKFDEQFIERLRKFLGYEDTIS